MRKFAVIKIAALAIAVCLVLCSYLEGAAQHSGWQCTGAETDNTNPQGCSTGSGCHSNSATAGITVKIELDSAGIPVMQYVAGNLYTVKLTGTNTTSSSLPKYGFRISAIKGTTTYATPSTTDTAGSWPTPYPANVHYATPGKYFSIGCLEQGTQLAPTSGTGGTGTTYVQTLNWKAPGAGTGAISFWAALNAVNDNGTNDAGDLWNTAQLNIMEEVTGIASVYDNSNVRVFPNPMTDKATFTFANEIKNGAITLYDMSGRKIKEVDFSGLQISVDKSQLINGIYFYCVSGENKTIATGKIMVQ